MNERKRIEERLRRKEQEIADMESQIKDARIYVQALQDVLKLLPRDQDAADAETTLRPGSAVALARDAILKSGAPLHVDDILRQLGREVNHDTKAALSGSLAAYVRRGEIFTRPKPNTFSLTSLSAVPDMGSPFAGQKPPSGFGSDQGDDT